MDEAPTVPTLGGQRPEKVIACPRGRAEPEVRHIARDARTNRRIRAREVRVIGPDAEQLGILTLDQALARAQEAGMDLVEVSPMAKPPVCKIMDYGKFKYEAKKKANEARKKQAVVHLKEVKLRPKTEDHDYDFKVKNVRRFISEGDKARITIMFRGREITHKEIGQRILSDVVNDVKDIAVIEQAPRMEGRQMFMILSPNPKVKAQAVSQAAAKAAAKAPAPKPKPEVKAEAKPAEPAPQAEPKPAEPMSEAKPAETAEAKPAEPVPEAAQKS